MAPISDVPTATEALGWDQQTYSPEGGVAGRAEQIATQSRLAHEMLVSEETGGLLRNVDEPAPGSEDSALVRLARREYERATKLPDGLVTELARVSPHPVGLGAGASRIRLALFRTPPGEDSAAPA